MADNTMGFTKAARDFFGLKEGQKLTAFAAELKELPYEDKVELAKLLTEELGIEVTVSPPAE